MKKLLIPLLLVLGVLTLFQGCSSGVERIGLQVHLVKLERNADGSLLASLQFSNPNVNSVNLASSIHQVTLNGKPAGVIEIVEPLGLPAQNAVTTTSKLSVSTAIAAEISGAVSYRLVSDLKLNIYDDDTERYKTSSDGKVSLE